MRSVQWSEFEQSAPELAAFAQARFVAGAAYLSTVRADGWPRVHPVGISVRDGRLVVPMYPTSPKGKDILRNEMFAAHCTVEDSSGGGGEVLLIGTARAIDADQSDRDRGWVLFELLVGEVLAITYVDGELAKERWRAE